MIKTFGILLVLMVGVTACTSTTTKETGGKQSAVTGRSFTASSGKSYQFLRSPLSRGFKALVGVFEGTRPPEATARAARGEYLAVAKEIQAPFCKPFGAEFVPQLKPGQAEFNTKFNSWSFFLECARPGS